MDAYKRSRSETTSSTRRNPPCPVTRTGAPSARPGCTSHSHRASVRSQPPGCSRPSAFPKTSWGQPRRPGGPDRAGSRGQPAARRSAAHGRNPRVARLVRATPHHLLTLAHPAYPGALLQSADPPPVLWAQGRPRCWPGRHWPWWAAARPRGAASKPPGRSRTRWANRASPSSAAWRRASTRRPTAVRSTRTDAAGGTVAVLGTGTIGSIRASRRCAGSGDRAARSAAERTALRAPSLRPGAFPTAQPSDRGPLAAAYWWSRRRCKAAR
jgi:hypothetical protein